MYLSSFKSNDKYGFKDGFTIVIPAKYDAAGSFNEGHAVVMLNNKLGIIDVKGDFVIENKYDDLYHLYGDFYVARINDGDSWKCGVINTSEEIIIDFQFKYIKSESDKYFLGFKDATEIKEKHLYLSLHGRYTYKDATGCNWYSQEGNFITDLKVEYHSTDYVIVKNGENHYGLLKSNGHLLIEPKYTELRHCTDDIFLATINSDDSLEYHIISDNDNIIFTTKDRTEYTEGFFKVESEGNDIKWYSVDGNIIYEGNASPLNKNYLRICKNGKYGVLNRNGQRIINFIYDEIEYITSFFAVRREDKLGLLGQNGEVIVDAIYKSIESVCIENNPFYIGKTKNLSRWVGFDTYKYAGYCEDYPFDSNGHVNYRGDKIDSLLRQKVYIAPISTYNRALHIKTFGQFNIDNILILDNGTSNELFSLSEGIINNSKFEKIEPLTQLCFAVKVGEKYGIFRLDEASIIIPVEYDRIIFYGGHTVLIKQGELWGAQSLISKKHILYPILKVDIPVENKEITILDDTQAHFSVKKTYTNYEDKEIAYFTIIDNKGVEVEGLKKIQLDNTLKRFDKNHYLTASNGKFGFVSEIGYVSIPFIYDEIVPKKTGNFNVRIGNAWGVIDINGHELVKIKYDKPMPIYIASPSGSFFDYEDLKDEEDAFRNSERYKDKFIVKDALSGYCGCINKEGTEIIPTVYEHLIFWKSDNHLNKYDSDFIFFGFGGYESEYSSTFFSEIECATWGCMNKDGKIIIDPKYDCFKVTDQFILAGRDGAFLGNEDGNEYTCYDKYNGVYDLYSHEGELIIGGFREFFYDDTNRVLALFFGGKWEKYCSYEDDWNSIYHYNYTFKHGNDLWLIIDENLKTIQRKEDGTQYTFNKGFIGKIEIKKEDKKITHLYNMPINLMAKGFSHFGRNCVFIKENNQGTSKIAALDYKTGEITPYYDAIKQINDDLFFVSNERKVAVRTISDIILSSDYYLFTLPLNGYFFGVKRISEDNSMVELFHIDDIKTPICVAIESVKTEELIDDIGYGRLKISFDAGKKLCNLKVPYRKMFSDHFLELIHTEESNYFVKKWEDTYYFSTEYEIGYDSPNDSYYDDDDHDYMRDSWDAMTDGMYGDMPDGFDGDFDFLGR